MNNKFSFLAVLGAVLLCSANVFALTCRNDYSSPSGCAKNADAAGDCQTLGYSTESVAGCSHYISCPFDVSYKRCTNVVCETGTYAAETDCKTTSGRACEKISNGCYKPVPCATGTYETETACKTASGRTCEKISTGCYKAVACATGTYETEEKCKAATGKNCVLNSSGCYEAVKTCPDGTYETEEECSGSNSGSKFLISCTQVDGCWKRKEPTLAKCLDYNLTSCPTNGTCSRCADDTTKLKLDSCNTNYYQSGSTSSPTCVSCASMKATMQNFNTLATMSYLKCSGTTASACRSKTACETYRYGSWDDACLPVEKQTSQDTIYIDVTQHKAVCTESLQAIADKITAFNEKCPNHKVTVSFVPSVNCDMYVHNGNVGKVDDN